MSRRRERMCGVNPKRRYGRKKKTPYDTPEEARAAAMLPSHETPSVYLCDYCHKYHWGHETTRDPARLPRPPVDRSKLPTSALLYTSTPSRWQEWAALETGDES